MDLFKFVFTNPLALVLLDYTKKVGNIIFVVNTSLKRWEEVLM